MPSLPFIVSGTIYDEDGSTTLSSVRVTVRNERTTDTLNVDTDSNGGYVFDLANLANGYSNGDAITVFVIYTNKEDYEEFSLKESDGGKTGLNLTLVAVPASDTLRYFTVQDFYDHHGLVVGGEGVPLTNEVVKVGTQVETEIDEMCSTRFSDGAIEITVDDCDATTGWSGSTDADAVTVSTDDADYRTKTGALDLGKSGATEAFFSYTKSTLTSRDFTDRVLGIWVSMTSLSTLRAVDDGAAITLRYGSSSSAYYEKTFYRDELTTGWNLLFFKLDDDEVTTTGTPDKTQMVYFQIRFDNTAASDTVTAGTFIMDNIFLVHQDHFIDEYIDSASDYQRDFYLSHLPVDRLLRFQVNRAIDGFTPTFDELRLSQNEIKLDKRIGKIQIINALDSIANAVRVFPEEGVNQVRATYIFGDRRVPRDVRKLAILMTMRDMMNATVSRALIRGQDSFTTEHFTVLDTQIDRILSRYQNLDIRNT